MNATDKLYGGVARQIVESVETTDKKLLVEDYYEDIVVAAINNGLKSINHLLFCVGCLFREINEANEYFEKQGYGPNDPVESYL